MGFTLFEDILSVLGTIAGGIVIIVACTFLYYRCLKPRCCPQRPPAPDTQASEPLTPFTIVQHVPPSQEAEQNLLPQQQFQQPNIQFYPQSPQQYPGSQYQIMPSTNYYPPSQYPPSAQYPPLHAMPSQQSFYPPPPHCPLPPIPQ